jgi:hypothetical protein
MREFDFENKSLSGFRTEEKTIGLATTPTALLGRDRAKAKPRSGHIAGAFLGGRYPLMDSGFKAMSGTNRR